MGNGTSLGRQKERNVAARRDVGAPRDSCRVKWVRAREAEIAYNAPPWDPGGNGIDELIRKAEIETQTEGTNAWMPRRGWTSRHVYTAYGEGSGAHSSTLAWKIPWTEEPGRLQCMGSLRVGHN